MLSDEKTTHLAHIILRTLKNSSEARVQGEEGRALRTIKQVLSSQVSGEEEIDRAVRARLASYARPPLEGSAEWDVLYRKFFEDELRRRRPTGATQRGPG